jgi:hypothetical protein
LTSLNYNTSSHAISVLLPSVTRRKNPNQPIQYQEKPENLANVSHKELVECGFAAADCLNL